MMLKNFLTMAAAGAAALAAGRALAQDRGAIVYDTPQEVFARGDFDGDGRMDVVIVDKQSGKFRLGYQLSPGVLTWVDCRFSGVKGVGGVGVGKLLAKDLDGLAFASRDANQITLVDVSSPTTAARPVVVPFTTALGPNTLAALEIGGPGKKGLDDLFVGSIDNSPEANHGTLVRNDGAEFPTLEDAPLAGAALHGNRLALKSGQQSLLCAVIESDKGDTLRLDSLASGKDVTVASIPDLPAGTDYAIGHFRGGSLPELVIYKPGVATVTVRLVEESSGNQVQLGKGSTFDLGQPVERLITIQEKGGQKLLAFFGHGEQVGVFDFDGVTAPKLGQTLYATNEWFTGAAELPEGLVLFSQRPEGAFSDRYHAYKLTGKEFAHAAFGTLSTLADNDNITLPEIYARIVANCTVSNASSMKPYTNTIPGTKIDYSMVPISGGTFLMGSPDSEAGHKPDEGPQHKVTLSPFWMGQYEITWNEYELFMYPDEEQRMRETIPTDEAGDKLADAVTHPSKPYVEMSFGMGKDGYPAISMTQHAANKYCQWLSAKTGEFYRLPTEAEWEYACRAGTTTKYTFGDDDSKLGNYAWYTDNSDFKYQKVGKKLPNAWGLYDIHGNVVEWVLDQYDPNYYKLCADKGVVVDPWNKATKPYPHAVRGGSWDDDAVKCRSAARRGSDRSWKMTDPQLPKSYWYLTDAQWVGFRLVRPLKVPSQEEMKKYWTSGVEKD